jgi:hypothetical protein
MEAMIIEQPTQIAPRETVEAPKRKKLHLIFSIQVCSFVLFFCLFLAYKVDWKQNVQETKKVLPVRAIKPEIEKRWRGGTA